MKQELLKKCTTNRTYIFVCLQLNFLIGSEAMWNNMVLLFAVCAIIILYNFKECQKGSFYVRWS